MAEEREAQEQERIKVVDRRSFTAAGDRRVPDAEIEAPEPAEAPKAESGGAEDRRRAGAGFERRPLDEPEGVDFTMLINAMAHPALILLGEIAHPDTGRPIVELEQARLQIDLLDLLRIKCRGNLTVEEEQLLEKVLYQLRMLYVAKSGARPA